MNRISNISDIFIKPFIHNTPMNNQTKLGIAVIVGMVTAVNGVGFTHAFGQEVKVSQETQNSYNGRNYKEVEA